MTRPTARRVVIVGCLFFLSLVVHHPGGSASAARVPSSRLRVAEGAMVQADTPTESVSPSAEDSPTPQSTATSTATPTQTALPQPSSTDTTTATPSPSASPSPSTTPSQPPSPTPTAPASVPSAEASRTPTPATAPLVRINEVAWSGTIASANDEWIELANFGAEPIDLTGWRLRDDNDIDVALSGPLPAHTFFLLERTDDSTISDIAADQIYTGNLSNAGETLWLIDPDGTVIDSANVSGGAWPAGNAAARASMERRGGSDAPENWTTFSGIGGTGHDANGNPIQGTPRSDNSPAAPVPTPTPTITALVPATPAAKPSILINEVAWSGTKASASDEWIELYNPGETTVDLSGWSLSDGGDIDITLAGPVPEHSFYLLERTDDSTIADVPADQIYTGGLSNAGEMLELRDAFGNLVDTANADGGGWPAGTGAGRGSMERRGGEDAPRNWGTFTGYHARGHDAEGSFIRGTPGSTNSLFYPTPEPTFIPGRIVINEVLIRPHYDWEGKGGVTTADEFIELFNIGPGDVNLRGWILDDTGLGGSKPYVFDDDEILPAGGFLAMFRSKTRIALNDTGDSVRISAPDGRLIDRITYLKVTAYNLSYGRLPDGSRHLFYGLWPTPFRPNLLFIEPTPIARPAPGYCPDGGYPQGLLPRLARRPAQARLLQSLGLIRCG